MDEKSRKLPDLDSTAHRNRRPEQCTQRRNQPGQGWDCVRVQLNLSPQNSVKTICHFGPVKSNAQLTRCVWSIGRRFGEGTKQASEKYSEKARLVWNFRTERRDEPRSIYLLLRTPPQTEMEAFEVAQRRTALLSAAAALGFCWIRNG